MTAETWWTLIVRYLQIGAAVSLVFLLLVGRTDRAARGAYLFRPLLVPGAILLWPLLLVRGVRAVLRGTP